MLELQNKDVLPALGLGTWKSKPGEVAAAVRDAIELGYRHIDCAAIYGNEAEVGEALASCFADGLVTREELWITSKLWNDSHAPADVGPALDRTLGDLGLDYLDLYLIHWPVCTPKGVMVPKTAADLISLADLPIATTWAALEQTVDDGRCRHLGVSNFSATKLASLLDLPGLRHRPEVNQVELHPYLQQPELVRMCAARGVFLTAYSPLGSGDRPAGMRKADEPRLLDDPALVAIAGRHGATVAQVLIAWALGRGTAVIPKSVRRERIAENFGAAEVELSAADMEAIAALDRGRRYVDGAFWAVPGSSYTTAGLWDE